MGTVRWTLRDNSASFPHIFVPYSFVCSWAPSANGRMSYLSPMSCWSNEVPRSRNRLCHISCHRPSHPRVEVFMERATFAAGSFERAEETFARSKGVQQTLVG